MGISGWVAIARGGMKSYRHVVCDSCGAETLAAGEIAFCSNCEGIVGSEAKTTQGSNPALFSTLNDLRTAVMNDDFDGATAIYDEMIKDKPTPQLLYAKGLMQIQHSNYVVSRIDYGGEGFMEHNAELRHQSA